MRSGILNSKLAQALVAGKLTNENPHPYGRIRVDPLVAVLITKVLTDFQFELAVVGVNGCTQSSLGGTALAEKLKNALNVAHPRRIVDVGNCSQRLRVRQVG